MVRRKIPITKITDQASLHITYSKRKYGIISKSYEMSILSNAKIALISFSQAQRLNFFSGVNRIEDVIEDYVRSPQFLEVYAPAQQEEALRILSLIRSQNDSSSSCHIKATALQQEEERKKAELGKAMDTLKTFQVDEGEIRSTDSISKIKRHESVLIDALQKISHRKACLLPTYNLMNNGPSTNQNNMVQNRFCLGGTSQIQPFSFQNHLLESQERQLSDLLNKENNLVQRQSRSWLEGPSQIQNCLPQTQKWQLPEPLNAQVSNVVNKQTHAYPGGPSTSIPVQSLPFPSVQDLQSNIWSQPAGVHLPPQNACSSNPPAAQASASYMLQDIAEEPANAGASMLPSMEATAEEVDYSSIFSDSYSLSDYFDL